MANLHPLSIHELIKRINSKILKLHLHPVLKSKKETACEMWNLIRLLPLILGPHVPEGNSYWGLFINFVELVEKLCSLLFTSREFDLMAEHIQLFSSKYVQLFDDVKLKPKAHFTFH